MRSVNPLRNENRCQKCHRDDPKLLGVLMVDFSMTSATAVIDNFRLATIFLVISISMVFGILIFLNQAFDYFKVE